MVPRNLNLALYAFPLSSIASFCLFERAKSTKKDLALKKETGMDRSSRVVLIGGKQCIQLRGTK